MDDEDLAAIEKRLLACSGPKWKVVTEFNCEDWMVATFGPDDDENDYFITTYDTKLNELGGDGAKADAEFVSSAPSDIAMLLTEVKVLKKTVESLEDYIEDMEHE